MSSKSTILFIILAVTVIGKTFAVTSFPPADTLSGKVAWEYELDELTIRDDNGNNSEARFYKSDALSSSDQVMGKLTGISAMKRGNYAYEPVMRGLSGGQINVSIDEMRILGACTDKMDPVTSYVEPNNLATLNVSHGATGFQTGSTVGGGFDMQIKKPTINAEIPWQTSVGSRYLTANNGMEALFNTSYGKDKFAVRVGGTYRSGDDYRAGGGEIVEFSGYNKVNYSASFSYLPSSDELINLSIIGDYAWDVGYPALPMDVGSADAKIIGLSYDKWFHHGKWEQLTAKIYYNRIEHNMDDSQRDVVVRMDMPGYTQTYGGFLKGNYSLNDRLSGEMKVDAFSTFAHAEMTMYFEGSQPMFMLTWPDVKRNVIGFQNRNNYQFDNGLLLSGGFRLEGNTISSQSKLGERQISVFQFGEANTGELLVNANMGVDKTFGKKYNASLNLSYGRRMPTEGEQYGFYLFNAYDGYDYIGRPDLRSEQALQVEASTGFSNKGLNINFTGFYYHFDRYIMGVVDDELSAMTIGANGVKVYQNLDFAVLAGMEAQIDYNIHKFSIINSTKFTYGRTIDNSPLPLIPPLKNYLEVNYLTKSEWVFNVNTEAAAEQDRINTAFGETETPGYFVAGAMVGKTMHFNKVNATFNFRVENIFDTYYYEHLDWGEIPRTGRNLSLSFLIDF